MQPCLAVPGYDIVDILCVLVVEHNETRLQIRLTHFCK